ncbi:MAG: tryptophan--tRNA ligase, partial [Pyramidobacter sp.]|nr:tryptophan--tRNA ligase [Pyramidobacter sp.]
MKKRIFSGMRPTGKLHLGHMAGALTNWIRLQNDPEYECFWGIMDWHAMTSNYADMTSMKDSCREVLIDWLATGLDPEKSPLFLQSHVREHVELGLALGMITPLGWLERCPTYKEQILNIKNKDLGNYGFLGYPVLMTADIIQHRPRWVPVGQDQQPHLELAREIVRRFNTMYNTEVFPEPEAKLTPAAKCPGLDGRKMSKSYGNGIFLKDTLEDLEPKIKGMFTDPARLRKSDPGNPDVCNLFPYHVLLADKATQDEVREACTHATMGCVTCKKIFMKNLQNFLEPLHERREAILAKPGLVEEILAEG